MIVSLQPLLSEAKDKCYAVGAFNVLNLEYAIGIIKAAEAQKSPVILQISPSIIQIFGLNNILCPCISLAKNSSVPVCVHLDHGKERSIIIEAISSGFSSVMFDGSSLPFLQNVHETKFLLDIAHKNNITLEAEIGKVGKEEDQDLNKECNLQLTSLEEASQFCKLTNPDALAISIGSIHGIKQPYIDLDISLLKDISHALKVPLVLHGSSGVKDESILLAIKAGITKINVATRLKARVSKDFSMLYHKKGESIFFDSNHLSQSIIQSVFTETLDRIKLFSSLQ